MFASLSWVALTGEGAASEPGELRAGASGSALPGADRVGFALAPLAPLTATGALGYGYTEDVLGVGDEHHRVGSRLAGAYQPLQWLGVALRLDGRYDAHVGGPDDGDDGFLAQSQLVGRVIHAASARLAVGAELAIRFPGSDGIGNGLAATSVDAGLLATMTPATLPLAVSANLGFRLDQSSHSVDQADRLSLSDRVALGASDSNAVALGIATIYRLARLDVLGEWTWDLQVGADAPHPGESPMRLCAGVRYWLDDTLHLELVAGVSPSARPEVAQDEPNATIEPRAWVTAGVAVYFAPPPPPAPEPAPPRAMAPPAPPDPGSVNGLVRAQDGSVLAGAHVELAGIETLTDAAGRFEFTPVNAGPITVNVAAEGYQAGAFEALLEPGQALPLELVLAPALPAGQIRGTVRSIDGKPLSARVVIDPLGLVVHAHEDGTFEVDVAPGEYRVKISAPGYGVQERPATVEEQGVTVILVDLGELQ